MLRQNTLKARLAARQTSIAAMLQLPVPALAEILALAGSDAVIFESEHSTLNEAQIEELARACELANVTAICRVPEIDGPFISRVLDAGVMGVIVPHICTARQAEAVVAKVKYPPMGQRGSGTTRASGYGSLPRDAYVQQANAETMVVLMIEDPQAVDNIEEIVAVPQVDCLFIGRGDLSLAMGLPASHPDVAAKVDRIVAIAQARSMPFMVACTEDEAAHWISRGASILSVQVVGFLSQSWRRATTSMREAGRKT